MERIIDIKEYGIRKGWQMKVTCGDGKDQQLWIPSKPDMNCAFAKMLFIVNFFQHSTRKEIFKEIIKGIIVNDHIVSNLLLVGNSFSPTVSHYWSDLHRLGYLMQIKNGRRVEYKLTDKGSKALCEAVLNYQKRNVKQVDAQKIKYRKESIFRKISSALKE